MTVRKAEEKDLKRILEVYADAKEYMIANGNPTQWSNGYPDEKLLREDISKGQLFVCTEEEQILAAFAFIIGKDPTYSYIDGKWLDDEKLYGTIHRIGAAKGAHGAFKAASDFAFSEISNVRVDTYKLNYTMQHLLEKYDFAKCGIIYLDEEKTDPRIAYQKLI